MIAGAVIVGARPRGARGIARGASFALAPRPAMLPGVDGTAVDRAVIDGARTADAPLAAVPGPVTPHSAADRVASDRAADQVASACRDGHDRVREALDDPAVTGSVDPAVLRHAGRAWMDHAERVEASLAELGRHLELP